MYEVLPTVVVIYLLPPGWEAKNTPKHYLRIRQGNGAQKIFLQVRHPWPNRPFPSEWAGNDSGFRLCTGTTLATGADHWLSFILSQQSTLFLLPNEVSFFRVVQAEARLSARRQARVEAREIRLRELERQQREQEENADKMFDMSHGSENALRSGARAFAGVSVNSKDRPSAFVNNYYSSRRSSEDSLEDSSYCLRDVKVNYVGQLSQSENRKQLYRLY